MEEKMTPLVTTIYRRIWEALQVLGVSHLFATSLVPLSVRSVTTLPVTPTVHCVDLMPMNGPSWAIFSNSNTPKAQLPKAASTASCTQSCWESSRVIHNFFWYYSYHPSLTFSVSMPSRISHYKHTRPAQVSLSLWCWWQVKKEALPVRAIAGDRTVPARWLCWSAASAGSMASLSHTWCRKPDRWCEWWLSSPRPAQEGVYSLIWRSCHSLMIPKFCSGHQPSAFLHLQIPTAKLWLTRCQNQTLVWSQTAAVKAKQ